jgi:NDP-sugar pyrophosphorylase family protein
MFNYHIETKSLVTLSTTEIVSPWGIMTIKDDKLISFDRERKVQTLYSSSGDKGLINSGLAWIDKSALNLIDLFSDIDFETELYKKVISLDKAVHYKIEGLWIPIDTPKDLTLVNLNDKLL